MQLGTIGLSRMGANRVRRLPGAASSSASRVAIQDKDNQ